MLWRGRERERERERERGREGGRERERRILSRENLTKILLVFFNESTLFYVYFTGKDVNVLESKRFSHSGIFKTDESGIA